MLSVLHVIHNLGKQVEAAMKELAKLATRARQHGGFAASNLICNQFGIDFHTV